MLEKSFNVQESENKILNLWERSNVFACHPESKKPAFSIVIPPPNVTGNLHLGHALDNSLQDTLCRYKRMKGFDVLWQPGTDHAGIATQMVVEKMLAKQGVSKHDLGREDFLKKVWEWKKQSGGQIIQQLHKLGASCDWSRERFTMDEGLSKAVRKIFVDLYKKGLIYKDKRLVNWDPVLQTAISDLEVIQEETKGTMWYFNYPIEGLKDTYICVATTRPETLFGDTAIAVSSEDERYKNFIGKNALLPIVNRPIPIISDEHADPTKGTGAVKITPAHDFNDFEVGRRHDLPLINILDSSAHLNENAPSEFQGLTTLEARKKAIHKMKELGLFVKEEPNLMTIPKGDRTNAIIEPWLTDQWFVNAKKLAEKAIQVVKEGQIEFVPKNWENTYFEWMNNIQPWCISRQLWWGHQVPVWYGPDKTIFCEETLEEAEKQALSYYKEPVVLTRDTDVLDTWFSSGLWAFSTLGWPEETPHLKKYYPTTTLITGFDIIFYWVARMIMMSLFATQEIPFKTVYLHGLVRDEKGQKMSKSKGNGIDPLEMIEKYGADALRFSLLIQAGSGRDIPISDSKIESYRNFITKLWNAGRLCEMNEAVFNSEIDFKTITHPLNQWILAKTSEMAFEMDKALNNYSFNDGAYIGYHFLWGTFCDKYLEGMKIILNQGNESEKKETRLVAGFVFESILKTLHPFIPFVTEELWLETSKRSLFLMENSWPTISVSFEKSEKDLDFVFDLITFIRSFRSESNIPVISKIELEIQGASPEIKTMLSKLSPLIEILSRTSKITFTSEQSKGCLSSVFNGLICSIPITGLIDIAKEKERLLKEIETATEFTKRIKIQLSNESFVQKAPKQIIDEKKLTLQNTEDKLSKLTATLKRLSSLS